MNSLALSEPLNTGTFPVEVVSRIFKASMKFQDSLLIGINIKAKKDSPIGRYSSNNDYIESDCPSADEEWFPVAHHKIGSRSNQVIIDFESQEAAQKGEFFLFDGVDSHFTLTFKSETMRNKPFNESLIFFVNHIRFSFEDMVEYVLASESGTGDNKPEKFNPVLDTVVIFTEGEMPISMIPTKLGTSAVTNTNVDIFSDSYPEPLYIVADGLNEIMLSESINTNFAYLVGFSIHGKFGLALMSDSRIIKEVEEFSPEAIESENEGIKANSFSIEPESIETYSIHQSIKEDLNKVSVNLTTLFKGDIPKGIKTALAELEEQLSRH